MIHDFIIKIVVRPSMQVTCEIQIKVSIKHANRLLKNVLQFAHLKKLGRNLPRMPK